MEGSKANASETEFIQSRIRAIASGGVPDNTNGSNAYRAGSYRGPWYQKHRDAPVIGGNRFAYEPGASNGPYAPYRAGADAPKGPPAPRFSTTPNTFNPSDYMRSQPMGSTSTSNDNSRTVSQNNPVTVNINGASDPQATASAVTRGVGQAHDMSFAERSNGDPLIAYASHFTMFNSRRDLFPALGMVSSFAREDNIFANPLRSVFILARSSSERLASFACASEAACN